MGENKMKRWIVLLALPYVVMQSEFKGTQNYFVANSSGQVVGTCSDKEFCDDLADALNQHHGERVEVQQPPEPDLSTSTVIPNTLEGSTSTDPVQ